MFLIRVITNIDLSVAEMGFILCGKYPLLMTRTEVSDPGPMGPLTVDSEIFA